MFKCFKHVNNNFYAFSKKNKGQGLIEAIMSLFVLSIFFLFICYFFITKWFYSCLQNYSQQSLLCLIKNTEYYINNNDTSLQKVKNIDAKQNHEKRKYSDLLIKNWQAEQNCRITLIKKIKNLQAKADLKSFRFIVTKEKTKLLSYSLKLKISYPFLNSLHIRPIYSFQRIVVMKEKYI